MNLFLFRAINQFAKKNPALDSLGIFIANYLGYFLIFALLILIFFDFRKYWKIVFAAYFAGFIARFLLVALIRRTYPIARPFVVEEVNLLILRSATPTFPSGHASFFFAISFLLFFWLKKMKNPPRYWKITAIFFFLSSSLIGLARVFCGVHWFLDIIGAAFVGLIAGWLTKRLAFLVLKNP